MTHLLVIPGLPHLRLGFPLLWLVAGTPFLTTLLGVVVRRHRGAAGTVAVLGALLSVVWGCFGILQVQQEDFADRAPGLGTLDLLGWHSELSLHGGGATMAAVSTIAIVLLATQAFARWYLAYDERYSLFAVAVSAAHLGTTLVLVGADLLLVVTGWSVLVVTVYALTIHWDPEAERSAAARNAITVAMGPGLMVAGAALLASRARSTVIEDLVGEAGRGGTAATVGTVLIAFAILIGAGQMPFIWWPRLVTRGPVPGFVAAYLTGLGASSVVLTLRMLPLLQGSVAMWVIVSFGALTVLVAGCAAVLQRDLVDLLVLQSVAVIGMTLVLAVLEVPVPDETAWFALLSWIVILGLLSLVVCWITVLAGSTSLSRAASLRQQHSPLRLPLAAALGSLAGLPPLTGFVALHLAVARAMTSPADPSATITLAVLVIGMAASAVTACRLWLVLTHRTRQEEQREHQGLDPVGTQIDDFFRTTPEHRVEEEADARLSHGAQTSLWALSALSIGGGVVALLKLLHIPVELHGAAMLVVTGVALVAGALTAAVSWGRFHKDVVYALPARVVDAFAFSRWGEAPALGLGWVARSVSGLALRVDQRGVALGTDAVGGAVKLSARVAQRLHASRPTSALAVVVLGAVVLAVVGVVAW